MAFYSDLGIRAYQTKISNYFLSFARHIDVYRNSVLVATIDMADLVWC